jgi:hypothetical protein
MTSTTPTMPGDVWTQMFWGILLYFALELVPAIAVKEVLHVTMGQLVGPYLAFAAPIVIFLPLAWWLRRREERGATATRLALAWGLFTGLFVFEVGVALFYSASTLRLIDPKELLGPFIFAVSAGMLVASFTGYQRARRTISARAAGYRQSGAGRDS